jgi:hypothetical protein
MAGGAPRSGGGQRRRRSASGDHRVQELIDADPVVRLYLHEMIAQLPTSKRHVESVEQLLALVNEVLTMAPEFGEDAMVATPLWGDPGVGDGHAGGVRRLPRPSGQRDADEDDQCLVRVPQRRRLVVRLERRAVGMKSASHDAPSASNSSDMIRWT